jgi:hypothetical protein
MDKHSNLLQKLVTYRRKFFKTLVLGQAFAARLELTRLEPLTGVNSNVWLSDLPQNIRLGCEQLTLILPLAYYDTAKITAVNSFIVLAPRD